MDLSVSDNIEQLLTGLPIYQSLDSDTFDGIVTAISDLNVVLGDLGHDPVGSDYASIISVLQIEFQRAVGELIRGEITTEIFPKIVRLIHYSVVYPRHLWDQIMTVTH